MGKIRVLPQEIASKIAAGEVVQRPESVVKELVENSIDAGAKKIEVEVKDAGKSFIRVTDDGTGMAEEDALSAFGRHATSKIDSYEDLENISSLGFRGEALYSIAAVSQVEMKTRVADSDVAVYMRIDGGNREEVGRAAHAAGTTIIVRNLFYNTPARRNFMKANPTEFRHIYQTVSRYAIAFPEIEFSLKSGDETVLQARADTVRGRLDEVFGERFTDSLVAFEEDFDRLKVSGFLGKPEYTKRTRGEQFFFLNRRYVITKAINHAVFSAYENLIDKGDFPFFVVFINLPPNEVDVNVHPSKLEVKFKDERSIYGAVRSATRSSLVKSDLVPEMAMNADNGRFATRVTTESSRGGIVPVMFGAGQQQRRFESEGITDAVDPFFSLSTTTSREKLPLADRIGDEEHPRSSDLGIGSSATVIYQLHNKYIISQISTGLLVIDQHAAHERVIYERTLRRFNEQGQNTQQLLFPISLNLDPGDTTILQEIAPDLNKMGFSIKMFSGATIVVDGVPVDLKAGRESTILTEIIEDYKRDNDLRLTPREKLCKTYACKAAVKAGDSLTVEEMGALIDQLLEAEVPYVCPHGRPVLVKIPLLELDKRFGRL